MGAVGHVICKWRRVDGISREDKEKWFTQIQKEEEWASSDQGECQENEGNHWQHWLQYNEDEQVIERVLLEGEVLDPDGRAFHTTLWKSQAGDDGVICALAKTMIVLLVYSFIN